MDEPSTPKTKSIAAALAVILPMVLTSIASFIESRQAKEEVATQSEKHVLDEARNDIWIREQWITQAKVNAELRAEIAELRTRMWRDRRRALTGEEPTEAPPVAPAVKEAMPEKPAREDGRVRKVAREMKP